MVARRRLVALCCAAAASAWSWNRAPAASRAEPAPDESERDAFVDLLAWFEKECVPKGGALVPGLDQRKTGKRGVVAPYALERGRTIVKVPHACALTDDDAAEGLRARGAPVPDEPPARLATFLMVTRREPDHFFQPWYRSMPIDTSNFPRAPGVSGVLGVGRGRSSASAADGPRRRVRRESRPVVRGRWDLGGAVPAERRRGHRSPQVPLVRGGAGAAPERRARRSGDADGQDRKMVGGARGPERDVRGRIRRRRVRPRGAPRKFAVVRRAGGRRGRLAGPAAAAPRDDARRESVQPSRRQKTRRERGLRLHEQGLGRQRLRAHRVARRRGGGGARDVVRAPRARTSS